MNPNDAFAPPKSAVDDAAIDAATPRIPMVFKGMLLAFFVLEFLGVVLGVPVGGIFWVGVMAIAAWRTLAGSYPASRVLGVFLAFNIVLLLVASAAAWRHSAVVGGVLVGVAAYMAVLVGYIFFNRSMQAAFRRADSKKWRGG